MKLLAILAGLFCFYVLQNYIYRRYWARGLTVEMKVSRNRATEGEKLVLEEVISNAKRLPLPTLKVKFKVSKYLQFQDSTGTNVSDYYNRNDMFSILMQQRITRTLPFVCTRRGHFSMYAASFVCSNFFMTEEYIKDLTLDMEFLVYPRTVDVSRFHREYQTLLGDIITKKYIQEDPFSFRGIREYQPYDSMKTVNWKSSAKQGQWMVNQRNFTAGQQVDIYLNLSPDVGYRDVELMEEAIRLTKTFALYFLERGMELSVYTNGIHYEEDSVISVESLDRTDERKLNEGLAQIDVNKPEQAFEEMYGTQLEHPLEERHYVFICSRQWKGWQQFLERIRQRGGSLTWIVPVSGLMEFSPGPGLKDCAYPWYVEYGSNVRQ